MLKNLVRTMWRYFRNEDIPDAAIAPDGVAA
jgi:hypothetical protein